MRKVCLAADQVAEAAEEQRAERPHQEASGERKQREDVARCHIECAEELRADDHRKRAVEIEVVPFENGSERRRQNDLAFLAGHRASARFDAYCGV